MSRIFGKKKSKGAKTVAIVDVESGSVASALAHISPNQAPKLFAETRIVVPLRQTRDTNALMQEIEHATEAALLHASEVATRMRTVDAVASQGEIDRVALFFAPPWAAMHLSGGTADFVTSVTDTAAHSARATMGDVPVSLHPFGTAAAYGAVSLVPDDSLRVLCIVGADVSELLILSPQALLGRATVPVGQHTLLRTLLSHGGVSEAEARSYMSLAERERHSLFEPLTAAEDHIAEHIASAAKDIAAGRPLGGVVVVTHEPAQELLARALTRHAPLAELFPHGGTVRALRATHAMPYIAAHARTPDLHLMLETLFINAKFSGI